MDTRNEIKISFKEPRYYTDGNSVTKCFLSFSVKLPHKIQAVVDFLKGQGVMSKCPTTANALAIVTRGDSFNSTKGKKVALAKAENAAYVKVCNWLYSGYQHLEDSIMIPIENFNVKVDKTIEHNDDYLGCF